MNRWDIHHLGYLVSYSGLTDTKQLFIKKIKKAAIPIICLVSPLFLIDNVIQELLYNRLQLVYLVNDCTLRLV